MANEQIVALGVEIRRRRTALGLTREALSEKANVTANHIGAIELGKRDPGLSTIMRIAHGLDTTAAELLGVGDLSPAAIEAGRLMASIPESVRKPLVTTLRALAKQRGKRR